MGKSYRWGLSLVLSLVALLLSGCFQYDLGITFDSQTHGQIVQQVRVSERAAALGGTALQDWLATAEGQVRRLGGQVQHSTRLSVGDAGPEAGASTDPGIGPGVKVETVRLVLPFGNGDQLVERFEQLFGAESFGAESEAAAGLRPEGGPESTLNGLKTAPSRLQLSQQNRFFAIRNHLICEIDLRSLPHQPTAAVPLLSSASDWLDLRFSLQTPWGIRQVSPDSLPVQGAGAKTFWMLTPGELNHVEVVFWVPSPLGLGGAAIAALVLLGYFLKYGLSAGRRRKPVRA